MDWVDFDLKIDFNLSDGVPVKNYKLLWIPVVKAFLKIDSKVLWNLAPGHYWPRFTPKEQNAVTYAYYKTPINCQTVMYSSSIVASVISGDFYN